MKSRINTSPNSESATRYQPSHCTIEGLTNLGRLKVTSPVMVSLIAPAIASQCLVALRLNVGMPGSITGDEFGMPKSHPWEGEGAPGKLTQAFILSTRRKFLA